MILLDRDLFYKCPNCKAYLYTHSLISGNTFGAKHYSDGKMIAPMFPEYSDLTKCEKCGSIFMLSRLTPQKISFWNTITRTIKRSYECRELEICDLYKSLDLFPEDELYIRLKIWWKYNDNFRPLAFFSDKDYCLDSGFLDSQEYQDNCYALLRLLNKNKKDEQLLSAEINRNLGNFTECLNRIPWPERENSIEKILFLECKKGNRHTIRVDNYFEILKQEAQEAEQERINEEMKDPRWKVCPNGHCYENIHKKCLWCGETNVVGRIDKDVCLQHKGLYVGKQNGKYILTSDANIPMQEERIRKITVDYYQDKFTYFHLDGKNPHPFYFNDIRLNQGNIKGRILTKLCEDIVSGKYDSVEFPL